VLRTLDAAGVRATEEGGILPPRPGATGEGPPGCLAGAPPLQSGAPERASTGSPPGAREPKRELVEPHATAARFGARPHVAKP
jgi:hypothetical protein